jgi:hypothetical protein
VDGDDVLSEPEFQLAELIEIDSLESYTQLLDLQYRSIACASGSGRELMLISESVVTTRNFTSWSMAGIFAL